MTNNTRITIKTVAKDAGVSVSAVSKVLRNAYGVSDSLREKVEASIKKLGYRPNAAARGLRGRTYTIGLLVSDLRNPFVPDLIDGVRKAADEAKYRIFIGVGRADQLNERDLVNSMIDHQMDGVILIGPRLSPEVIESYGKQIPVVCLAYHHATATNFDTINSDDFDGAHQALTHLISAGHEQITMLSLNTYENYETNVFYQREQGYKAAMVENGLGDFINIHRLSDPIRRDPNWADSFLTTGARQSAVFCWSDIDGIELLSAAQRTGLAVSESLSIVGFDNSSVGGLPQIGLSTINQDGFELGNASAQALFARIEGRKEPVHALIQTNFVARESVACKVEKQH